MERGFRAMISGGCVECACDSIIKIQDTAHLSLVVFFFSKRKVRDGGCL